MELDQLEELSTKTNEELIEMSIELIKTLYKNKPKQGFRLESGTFVKDSEHYFKSYKSYLTKPNNIRSITTGELKEDWVKWYCILLNLKKQIR
ncbi:hypothetical protein F0358_10650 [Empedobacter brevis]|uniref:hypothetical protein n=1 Tax=Empedobacter brevis TaxID=247 RepID=UPI00123C8E5F|nr:hypothetical protein [Empedobacter brevis]QES93133.1 hypothetical protein F0358_10650 [Empedobacter brevis]